MMKMTPFLLRLKKIRHVRFVGQISSKKAAVSDNKNYCVPLVRTPLDASGNCIILLK